MNPLSWKGPEFLVFYGCLSFCVALVVRGLVRSIQGKHDPHSSHIIKDPYAIAYLRGAEFEVIRVCIVSLIDRGLLTVDNNKIKSEIDSKHFVEKPVEKEILQRAAGETSAADLMNDPVVLSAAQIYRSPLEKLGYLFHGHTKNQKTFYLFAGYSLLIGLAAAKFAIALEKNKPFIFLAVLTFLVIVGFHKIAETRLTKSGRECLNGLEILLNNVSARLSQLRKGETNELALIVAVYGISVLPVSSYPYTETVFARANKSFTSDSGGVSCGSSCGSSCSSSCGGGCGGGCGGCGS